MQTIDQTYQDVEVKSCCDNPECAKNFKAAVDAYRYIKLQLLHTRNKLKVAEETLEQFGVNTKEIS